VSFYVLHTGEKWMNPLDCLAIESSCGCSFFRRAEFSGDVSGELQRATFAFIGEARVLPGSQKRVTILADLLKIEENKTNDKAIWRWPNVLIISANVVNNHQESLYQPRESIWVTYYAVNLTVGSLPFTAASTATAVLPWGAKMRFYWLTE